MAQIERTQRRPREALPHLTESYDIYLKLGQEDGICGAGLDLGPLLYAAGKKEVAIEVLDRSRQGFGRLGLADKAEQARRLVDAIRR